MCVYLTEEVFQLSDYLIGEAFAIAKDRGVPLWSGEMSSGIYFALIRSKGFSDSVRFVITR